MGIDGGQVPAHPRLVGVLDDAFPGLRVVDLFRMVEHGLDGAELLDQAEGAFRSDTGHAGDIVGGVPHEAEDFHHLVRGDAEALAHSLYIVDGLLHRVDHDDMVADQLHQVLVPGNDHDLEAFRGKAPGQGADDIVGFGALLIDDGNGKPPDDVFDVVDLRS